MLHVELPAPIARYFYARQGSDVEKILACFAEDAMVWDNGEDLELKVIVQVRQWMAGPVAGYELTYEVTSIEQRGDEYFTSVVVSGKFPGSPYRFDNRFKLRDDKIVELVIDPIGSLADPG